MALKINKTIFYHLQSIVAPHVKSAYSVKEPFCIYFDRFSCPHFFFFCLHGNQLSHNPSIATHLLPGSGRQKKKKDKHVLIGYLL